MKDGIQGVDLVLSRRTIIKAQISTFVASPALTAVQIFTNYARGLACFIEAGGVVATQGGANSPVIYLAESDNPIDGITDEFGGGALGSYRAINNLPQTPGIYVPSGDIWMLSVDGAAAETIGIRLQIGLYIVKYRSDEPGSEAPLIDTEERSPMESGFGQEFDPRQLDRASR